MLPFNQLDDTVRVRCSQCHRDICRMPARGGFSTVTCAVCNAFNNGIIIPPHIIAQMENPMQGVQFSDPNYDPILEMDNNDPDAAEKIALGLNKFKSVERKGFRRMWQRIRTAILDSLLEPDAPIIPKSKDTSTAIAQRKKSKRIFDGTID